MSCVDIEKAKKAFKDSMVPFVSIGFGEAEIADEHTTFAEMDLLRANLLMADLEIVPYEPCIVTNKIKRLIVEYIDATNVTTPRRVFSQYLCERLNYDYTYMSNCFSKSTGTTIERYVMYLKVERAKTLMQDYELRQVARTLQYCSLAHFSRNFKMITGTTPSSYYRKNIQIKVIK